LTDFTSYLIFKYESGALNEAFSDIMGACVDKATGATGDAIWKMGEDIYTPGTPGDALRYMYMPTLGKDYDYYPERYTGSSDSGGVHWNSGIANLAFYPLRGWRAPKKQDYSCCQRYWHGYGEPNIL
jgi:vibriolysin